MRGKSRFRQDTGHEQRQVFAVELRGGQVHRDANLVIPRGRFPAGGAQDEFANPVDEAGLLGQRNEFARRHWATQRMRPAHQSFAGVDLARRDVNQRLEEHHEPVGFDGFAQIYFHHAAGLHHRVHVGGIKAVAALAVHLGLIQRQVRGAQQVFDELAVGRGHGDADTGADEDLVTVDVVRRRQIVHQLRSNLFGLLKRVIGIGLAGDEDDEFVAAKTGDHVCRCQPQRDPASDFDQQKIASHMAQCVVHGLEAVEIEAEQGEVETTAARLFQPLGETPMQHEAVRQAGECIVGSQVSDPGKRAGRHHLTQQVEAETGEEKARDDRGQQHVVAAGREDIDVVACAQDDGRGHLTEAFQCDLQVRQLLRDGWIGHVIFGEGRDLGPGGGAQRARFWRVGPFDGDIEIVDDLGQKRVGSLDLVPRPGLKALVDIFLKLDARLMDVGRRCHGSVVNVHCMIEDGALLFAREQADAQVDAKNRESAETELQALGAARPLGKLIAQHLWQSCTRSRASVDFGDQAVISKISASTNHDSPQELKFC